MLTICECQNIVQSYLSSVLKDYEHYHGTQLIINNNKYKIKPDDTYITKNGVIVVEYENNKRPVESISKFWWLLKNTNWLNEDANLRMLLIGLNPTHKGIRSDSVKILGYELENQFPDNFKFFYVSYENASMEEIIKNLKIIAC